MTAKQIAARTGVPDRSVRHHLGQLEKGELIERTAGERRRGVHQFYYRLVRAPRLDLAETQSLTPPERLRVSTETLKNAFSDVSASLAAGIFDSRPDRCVTIPAYRLTSRAGRTWCGSMKRLLKRPRESRRRRRSAWVPPAKSRFEESRP